MGDGVARSEYNKVGNPFRPTVGLGSGFLPLRCRDTKAQSGCRVRVRIETSLADLPNDSNAGERVDPTPRLQILRARQDGQRAGNAGPDPLTLFIGSLPLFNLATADAVRSQQRYSVVSTKIPLVKLTTPVFTSHFYQCQSPLILGISSFPLHETSSMPSKSVSTRFMRDTLTWARIQFTGWSNGA